MGQLTQTVTLSTTSVNLTSVGLVDWADWTTNGLTATDWMSGAGHTVPNPTLIGTSSGVTNNTNDPRTISWTNGTNTGSSSNTDSIYNTGDLVGDGLQLVLPADTNIRTVYVYASGYNAFPNAIVVTSSLSDGSASSQTDSTTMTNGGSSTDSIIKLAYQANSNGQSLTLQWYCASAGGTANLQAVAYASVVAASSSPFFLASSVAPLAWIIRRRQKLAQENRRRAWALSSGGIIVPDGKIAKAA